MPDQISQTVTSYTRDGIKYIARLIYEEGKQPRIRINREGEDFATNDVELAEFMAITNRRDAIRQVRGDGPEVDIISPFDHHDIHKAAMQLLPPILGRFEIVWVPAHPGMPF